jgi:hypothetical protein
MGEVPSKSDSHLDEAFRRGESAAHKERAAKATAANRRENRPEWRLLIEAIKAVCNKLPLEDSDKFAESILKEVCAELELRLDSKTRLRLAKRKKPFPGISTIRRAIRFIPRNGEKLRFIPKEWVKAIRQARISENLFIRSCALLRKYFWSGSCPSCPFRSF